MALTAVDAISDMVAPVVLLTVGGMLSNGLITIYSDIDNRMRDMTRERGLAIAATSVATSADAITYAVKRTSKFD